MDKSTAKFILPAGLAVVLLVVLRAQNQSPAPPATGTTPTTSVPTKPRPRSVVTPPPTVPAPVVPAPAVPAPAESNPAAASTGPAASGAPATGKPSTTQPAPPVTEVPKVPAVITTTTVVETPAPSTTPATTPAPGTVPTPAATTPTTPPPTPGSPRTTPGSPASRVPRPGQPNGATVPVATTPPAVPLREGPVILSPVPVDPDARVIEFKESAMDVGDILDEYEKFTGRSTMRDGTIQGTQLPLRSNGLMTRKQAAEYIKAFLLLNGYSIVPSGIKDVDKVIPTARAPQLESGPEVRSVYTDPKDLPETDQVINYILYLKNIGAEEAQRSLSAVVTPGRQGNMSKITPVPAAGALIITDSIPAIRLAIALQEKIDVASAQVVKKFFRLDRADAEEVAQVLTEILAAQTKLRNQASGGGTRSVPVANAGQQLQNALPPGAVVNVAGGNNAGSGNQASQPPDESTVIVKAITRTNEVLVSGRPGDIKYLEDLIHELDKEAKVKNLKRFQLRFIRVEDFLTIAQDAIGRGQETIQSGPGGAGAAGGANRPGGAGGQRTPGQGGQGGQFGNAATTFGSNTSSSRSSTSASRSGSTGGAGGGLNRGRSSSSGGTQVELIPTSQVVGKTLLISEPRSNTLLVAGPPEHLTRIAEVLREMDVKPLQISISAVIAEVTLDDTLEHGVDILRKVESIVAGGQDITYAGSLTNIGGTTQIIDPNTLTSVAAFQTIGNGLNLYGQLGEYFNVFVHALEQTGRVQVISRPFIFTANNKEADISIGRRVPVPASSQSSVVTGNTTTFNTNIEYEDVNLELIVTPLINSKDEVTLTITQTNDDVLRQVTVGSQSAPEISQQTLDTEVAVPNGGIAVIGGLIRDKDNANHNGLPWITRVPILRGLLGHTSKVKERTELLILIQPRIVGTSEELEAMHTDHVRRTIIGKEAEKMAQPAYNTNGIVLPTENGDVPLDSASSLLPAIQTPAVGAPGFEGSLKTTELDKENLPLDAPSTDPANPDSLPVDSPQTTNRRFPAEMALPSSPKDTSSSATFDSTIPNEKRKPAFWENPPEKTPEKSGAPDASDPKSSGLKRFLPWNWGKKQKPAA